MAEDELYSDAKEIVVMAGKASASLLQRRLRVGYARAARLLDMLEEEGIIGQADGAKPRDVLIDPMSLDRERAQTNMPMNSNLPKNYRQHQSWQRPPHQYPSQPPPAHIPKPPVDNNQEEYIER